ncbi:MAG: T9SS type A sorting domain-containing protein, partial [bacterium]|nr:T9SS type A sorting domain-containing protein [bacterium]
YNLENSSSSGIDGLRIGLLVDFDLPGGNEQLTYDPSLNLTYQYNSSGEVVGFIGLKGVNSFSSVSNPSGSKAGLSMAEKYALISSDGIQVDQANSGDYLLVAGSHALNIAAGRVEEVAYAIIVAPTISDLLLTAQEARNKFDILTSITASGTAGLPVGIELRQNYPNPFNPTTTISFRLTKTEQVSLDIYNLLGQKVTTLFEGRLPTGFHSFDWDASSESGQRAASGIYFYRLSWSNGVESRKMVLIK